MVEAGGGRLLWPPLTLRLPIFSTEWRKAIAERYGNEPTITYIETPVIIDNTTGDVIAEAAE